jgi:Transmembrane secretion effector
LNEASGLARYRALFAHRAVTLLVTAQLFTRLGDQFVTIGLLWEALELTHRASSAGLVLMAYTSGALGFGLFSGSLLDRFPRKLLMLADNALRCAVLAGMAVAAWRHALTIDWLIVLAILSSVAAAITMVGVRAYLPTMLPEGLIVTAFAVDSAQFQIASIVGPALAGLVTARYGAVASLSVAAGLFACFVALAAFIPGKALDTGVPPQARPMSASEELRGARYILTHPVLRPMTMLLTVGNFFFGAFIVGLAFLSKDIFGNAAQGQGIMLAALAAGALLASLVMGSVRWPWPRGLSFIVANVLLGVFALFVGLAPSLAIACVLLALLGAADAALFIWMSEIRQRTPPPELVARVIGASMLLNVVSVPFAQAAAGFAVTPLGVRPMLALSGGLLVLYSLFFFGNAALRKEP